MDRVMAPRFLNGVDSVVETLDEITRDCEGGEVEAIACVVVIGGEAWRYQSVPEGNAELIRNAIEDLAADVETS